MPIRRSVRLVHRRASHLGSSSPVDEFVTTGEIQPPNVIKMDVEGAEPTALTGAGQLLTTARPKVLAEVLSESPLQECTDILESGGYGVRLLGRTESSNDSHIPARPREVSRDIIHPGTP